MSTVAWREEKSREVLADTLRSLERRRLADPGFSLADAEGVLAHLYIREGNDQEGRGELQDLILASTIAAYQEFIAAWKAGAPGPAA